MTQLLPWYFFFSSRRRHTRWPRDWSSDVCSSDLGSRYGTRSGGHRPSGFGKSENRPGVRRHHGSGPAPPATGITRSEERRVGKEGRDRGEGQHAKKKGEERGEMKRRQGVDER